MEKVIKKADVLIEALPYIQRFRGEIVVVKFGGSAMEDPQLVADILEDVAFMECVGLCPVIVHGGGKAITRRMNEAGLEPAFVHGRRVTDESGMHIVERVLNREVNPQLVRRLETFGCKARGLHGEDIFKAEPRVERDPDTGETIDWGFVGHAVDVDVEPILAFVRSQIVPAITPLGTGPEGHLYNINADDAAVAAAEKLKARKLVCLSDVPGVMREPGNPESLVSTLTREEMEHLIEAGIVSGGMVPKIGGALKALKAGVRKTHIIDAAMPHSLLLELFTNRGVGTEILP